MENIFVSTETLTLLQAVERIKPPANFLTNTFFPNKLPTANTSMVALEYRKGKRKLAPFIVRGSRGVNIARENANAKFYAAPLMGPRRIISIQDIERRIFGEQPVFSVMTPEERAAALQAKDLSELLALIENRKNKLAADILQTGKTVIKGFADDGKTQIEDEIDFDFDGILTPSGDWANPAADIYGDIQAAVNKIAEDTGELPDIMVCGKNVEKYLLKNKQIFDWLSISNPSNLQVANLLPKYINSQARYIGRIMSLGVEIYGYLETYYEDETDTVKPFLDPNTVIIAKAGAGWQVTGAITLLENGSFKTYAAEYVPQYSFNSEANQVSLAIYSRFIPVPDAIDNWVAMKVSE